ncbi:MAG: T9SS type A sorting domain-containing protein [bacterium]|nr:T9SS type A sorting domain-containing protein [bacterium]
MLKVIYFILFSVLAFVARAQDFNITAHFQGASDQPLVGRLSDSSLVCLTFTQYLTSSNVYDSLECVISRLNARGQLLYYSKMLLPSNMELLINDMTVSGDRIFLAGFIRNKVTDKFSAFIMRLNECLEVEKYNIYNLKNGGNPYFNKLFAFSDSAILVLGNYFIQSDTTFLTVFKMDHDFGVKWFTSLMGFSSDVAVANNHIHLWGYGYYPEKINSAIAELKLNYAILDFSGKVKSQYVKNEHEDFFISIGKSIVASANSAFLLANEGLTESGSSINILKKIRTDGTVLKTVQLNDNNIEEGCGSICRINDNRYIVIGVKQLDFEHIWEKVYLVDSNLNVIRKKQLLPNYPLVELCGVRQPIPFHNGSLLYGRTQTKTTGVIYKGTLYKIDTFLNVMPLPSLIGYSDSLCPHPPVSGSVWVLPIADTIWLDDLALRNNIKLRIESKVNENENIIIFPNPSKGLFTLTFSQPLTGSLRLYNAVGQVVYSTSFNTQNQLEVLLENQVAGVYYAQVQTTSRTIFKKIIFE